MNGNRCTEDRHNKPTSRDTTIVQRGIHDDRHSCIDFRPLTKTRNGRTDGWTHSRYIENETMKIKKNEHKREFFFIIG